jgi:predicted lipoprotein with Yx(FWY)xxD motif
MKKGKKKPHEGENGYVEVFTYSVTGRDGKKRYAKKGKPFHFWAKSRIK